MITAAKVGILYNLTRQTISWQDFVAKKFRHDQFADGLLLAAMKFPFFIPTDRDVDVFGFGTNAVDFLIRVPHFPAFTSKVELTDYSQAAGGEIASTMVGLARLGMRTAYIGRFGDDEAGDFGIKTLIDEGIDVRYAERVTGARTQIAFILIDEASGERTVIWKRTAS